MPVALSTGDAEEDTGIQFTIDGIASTKAERVRALPTNSLPESALVCATDTPPNPPALAPSLLCATLA